MTVQVLTEGHPVEEIDAKHCVYKEKKRKERAHVDERGQRRNGSD